MEENAEEPLIELHVDYDAGNILTETTRWTRFISIIGIIAVAFLLLTLLFAGNTLITSIYDRYMPGMAGFTGVIMFVFILAVAFLGLMVSLLYRFSTLIKKGIEMQDQDSFNKGLNSLKVYFVINGVFALLTLLSNLGGLFTL